VITTGQGNRNKRIKQRKTDWTIATWNIQTLLQAGKMYELSLDHIKYNIDLIALQQLRWCGQGYIHKKRLYIIL